ncbi:unnamed protein product, partial [marine sediment metagenome]
YINRLVINYYNGKHPKHHLWKIHYKFIIDNIKPGEKVLDIGCGGSMSYNQQLAKNNNIIDAVDKNSILVQKCSNENKFENIKYYVLDISQELPSKKYDIIILSHVLEHINNPVVVLHNIKKITNKIIVRLPRYDNDWMKLVKKDLGMYYYNDLDHKQEFTQESAEELVRGAGWKIITSLNDVDIKILATLDNKS